MIRIDVATLFPEMCNFVMDTSIIGRARKEGKFVLNCHNIRDYTLSKQKRVDDAPYSGGHGMIMQADPIARCLDVILWQHEAAGQDRPLVCFLTPGGKTYTQQTANELAAKQGLVLVCGHYEGIDERVVETYADMEISLGDFVISGGELAALAVADSVLRLQPGVLKSSEGYEAESFYTGLLEHPHYTRPEVWRGMVVPPILLSGHAANIEAWRHEQALARTAERRPDLYAAYRAAHAGEFAPPKPKRKRKGSVAQEK